MDWLGYIANAFIFSGAVSITVAPRWSQRPPIFVLFLIGHILWLMVAILRPDGPLILLNSFFVMVDIVAILIRCFKYDIEGKTSKLWGRILKRG